MTVPAGSLFDDRYRLISQLGSGTQGDVWHAVDTRRNHEVALKILANTREEDAWHEATRLTALTSPHILAVNNAGLAVDVPYLDTVLARQGTAETAADPRGMGPERAVRLMRGVLNGLELCHQRGVLHRDVKPANVFLTETGDAQLGDFGLAAIADGAGTASVAGDPDVRAPEALKGARHDARADVYSAGLTLYALLTGSLPHSIERAGDFKTHKANVLAGMPDIRDVAPHIGTALGKVVRTALAAKAVNRYSTAALFNEALGRLPKSSCSIEPVDPHPTHRQCWSVIRIADQHAFEVCVEGDGRTITTRHRGSGNRLTAQCSHPSNDAAVGIALRQCFNALRTL